MNNKQNKTSGGELAVIIVFAAVIAALSLLTLLLPANNYSAAERRALAQAPQLSWRTVASGEYFADLENYLLDQFAARDVWRTANVLLRRAEGAQDISGIYTVGDCIYKIEYPADEQQLLRAAASLNSVCERYLDGCRVFYSVVPDKNCFVAAANGRPALDYTAYIAAYRGAVTAAADYIDITALLDSGDYYRTDIHWQQQNILDVADALLAGMGAPATAAGTQYNAHELYPFRGALLGQSALNIEPDTLVYLTSLYTDAAAVEYVGAQRSECVYDPALIDGTDGYDVYLGGAVPIAVIDSPLAASDRELIIFRDSFGSSIAPLLLGSYARITLVDLRYVSSDALADYIDFHGQDVLFLYSTLLLNSAGTLR